MHLQKFSRKKRYLLMAAVAGMLVVPGFAGKVNAEEAVVQEKTESEALDGTEAGSEEVTVEMNDIDSEEVNEEKTDTDSEEVNEEKTDTDSEEVTDKETETEVENVTGVENEAEPEEQTEDLTETVTEEPVAEPESVPAAVADTTNGWYTDESGNTYYYVDGKMVTSKTMEIGGALYAFNSSGKLIKDQSFSIYINSKWFYGRAKADGKMYRAEWYQKVYNGETTWYYYDGDGWAARDLFKVGNKTYLFDDTYGELMIGKLRYLDGTWYAGDEHGYPVALSGNGWKQCAGQWFYLKFGDPVKDCVVQIGSKYYGFDEYGRMFRDTLFGRNIASSGVNGMFKATADGSLLTNTWYQENGYLWYYFGSNGMACTGYQVIKNTPYIFSSNGYMMWSTVWTIESGAYQGLYYVDRNGKATKIKEGWNLVGSDYIYIKNGSLVNGCIMEIGGKLYAFDSYGFMYKNGSYYCPQENELSVRAKAGGELYRNEWYKGLNDIWFYYDNEGKTAVGVRKINGVSYAFAEGYDSLNASYGAMLTSGTIKDDNEKLWVIGKNGHVYCPDNGWFQVDGFWYYSETGSIVKNVIHKVNGKYYGFDANGRLYTNTRFMINGSYYRTTDGSGALLTGQWYGKEYYKENGLGCSGKTTLNGKVYYFRDGAAITDENILIDSTLYYADKNGVLSEVTKNGVYLYGVKRSFSYVENGTLVKSAWRKLGGNYYYFDKNGGAVTYHAKLDGVNYYFRPDGTMLNNGWNYTRSGEAVYLKGSGEALTGVQKIGSKYYYFDSYGVMQTGIVKIDGTSYYYNESGAYVGKLNDNGWTALDGLWFYCENGSVVRDTAREISGKYYYFDRRTGAMIKNYVDTYYDHIYGSNGARVTSGWVYVDGDWFYVNPESGRYVYGRQTVNGKEYMFNSGRMLTEDYFYGGMVLRIASNGEIIKQETVVNGQYNTPGPSVYYRDGYYYTGWVGSQYYSYGNLVVDQVVDGYLVDGKGNWVKKEGLYVSKSQDIDYGTEVHAYERRRYVKSNGLAAMNEWIRINGDWYYFNSRGEMAEASFIRDFTLYILDSATGKLLKSVKNPADGWYATGKSWIYVSAGTIKKAQFMDQGKVYNTAIMYSGEAVVSTVGALYYGDYTPYYYGSSGAAVTSYTGWKQLNGQSYYYGTTGRILQEWFTVGGKTYYCDTDTGLVTGWRIIDGILYHFNSSGQLTERVSHNNGWLKKGNDWYYYENGTLYTKELLHIGTKTYLMDEGKLVVNGSGYDYASDANGEILRNAWKKIGTKWYYFGSNGRYAVGQWQIDGKLYYFNDDGVMQ